MLPAILVTIFCCLIGGIVSIVYASQANSMKASGNYAAAARAADSAKTWILVSVVGGVLVGILTLVAQFGSVL